MADIFEGVELTPAQKQELATLRAGFALVDRLTQDQKVGLDVKRRLRELHPEMNVRIPEDDIAEPMLKPVREQVTTLQTQLNELGEKFKETTTALETAKTEDEQRRTDQKALTELEKSIDAASRKYRFTDEGKAALIEHMKTTGTSDPDTAGAYLVQHMEKPSPATSNGMAPEQARRNGAPDVDLFQVATGHDDESLKLLHTKPLDWMNKEVSKIIAEGVNA
jgi:hypothetical protein